MMDKNKVITSRAVYAFSKAAKYAAAATATVALMSTGVMLWAEPQLANGIAVTTLFSICAGAIAAPIGLVIGAHQAKKVIDNQTLISPSVFD